MGGRGKHNFLFGGAFRKAKYEIRRRRKKIGIGKRGRAKIPSPQPPSFLPARAIGFQNSEFGFSSKKIRTSIKKHRQVLRCLDVKLRSNLYVSPLKPWRKSPKHRVF